MEEFRVLLAMTTIIGSLLFAIWLNHFLFEIAPFVRAWGRKNISKLWDRLKRTTKRQLQLIRKENTMKPSKLFNWIWSKKQQEEYSFEPVWTPREINDQKYEARQRRERYLAAKYLSNNQIANISQRVAIALPWSVAYTLIPKNYNLFFHTLIFSKKHEAVGLWVHVESAKKAQVRACAINNIYKENIS